MAVTTATTNIENGIMPPPPRRAMGPARTVDGPIGRFLLPIGGGSAEATWTLLFHIKRPRADRMLPQHSIAPDETFF